MVYLKIKSKLIFSKKGIFKFNIWIIILIILLIFNVFLNISCNSKEENVPKDRIVFWTASLKPYFTDYIQNVINNFEAIYGVKVEWQDVPLDSIYQKLQAAYYTDFCPNIVNLNLPLAYVLYSKGYIYSYDFNKEFLNYNNNLVSECIYENKIFTFPWYSSIKLLIFNKEIFDFGKVKFNDIFEFLKIVKVIKESRGAYGFYPFIKFEQDMLAFGFIDDPNNVFNPRVLKFYKTLVDMKDYLPAGFWISNVDIAYSMYKDKKVASILIGPQFVYRIKKEDPVLYNSTDVIRFPFKYYPVSLMVLSTIYKKDFNNSKYLNSYRFIRFITNKQNQTNFAKLVPVLPSVKVNLSDIIANQDDNLTKKIKNEMLGVFDKAKVFDLYFVKVINDPVKRNNIYKNFNNEVFSSNSDIYEVFKKYQKIWDSEKQKTK